MGRNRAGLAGALLGITLGIIGLSGCGTNGTGVHSGNVERFHQAVILSDGREKLVEDIIYPATPFSERKRTTRWGNKEYRAHGRFNVLDEILEDGVVVYRRQTLEMPWDFAYFGAPFFGVSFAALASIDTAIAICTEVRPYSGENGVGRIEGRYLETVRRIDGMKNIARMKEGKR
jgi:hypothetical protein